jgi:tetratricopeptide (TPR) repeat protein
VLKAQELNQQGNQDSLPKIRELLDKAVDQEPENIGLLIDRADFFLGHKQYHEAIKDCDAIVTKSPRAAVAYLYRAIANINLSESGADIEADLRKAIKCDPHYSDALIWLSARMESPDPNEALKLLYQSVTEGIRWFANIPYVYSRIAALQSNLGRYKEAAEATRIAIAMKSDVLDYYEQLAVAERGLGKSLKNAAREVARFCQTQAEARSALGQKWNAFNTYWTGFQFLAAAKSQGSDAVDVQPEIVSMVSGVSKVLESIGSKEQAIVFWNSATNSFKANDEALKEEVFLGTIASKEQAIVFWNSVIKSGQFKAYDQVFKDEINRLSATRGSAAPVQ